MQYVPFSSIFSAISEYARCRLSRVLKSGELTLKRHEYSGHNSISFSSFNKSLMTLASAIFSVKTSKNDAIPERDFIGYNCNLAQQDAHVVRTRWEIGLARQKLSNTTDFRLTTSRSEILTKILPHTCGNSWANWLARQRAQLFTSSVRRPLWYLVLQAKESKHSGVKKDFALTKRSRSTGALGKWF